MFKRLFSKIKQKIMGDIIKLFFLKLLDSLKVKNNFLYLLLVVVVGAANYVVTLPEFAELIPGTTDEVIAKWVAIVAALVLGKRTTEQLKAVKDKNKK